MRERPAGGVHWLQGGRLSVCSCRVDWETAKCHLWRRRCSPGRWVLSALSRSYGPCMVGLSAPVLHARGVWADALARVFLFCAQRGHGAASAALPCARFSCASLSVNTRVCVCDYVVCPVDARYSAQAKGLNVQHLICLARYRSPPSPRSPVPPSPPAAAAHTCPLPLYIRQYSRTSASSPPSASTSSLLLPSASMRYTPSS